jgi:AmpD protein
VVHGISLPPGEFGGEFVEALFLNQLDTRLHPSLASLQGVRVSPHLYIDRRGRVTQFVPFHLRAWHAGVSRWQGRERCNDFAVGVELEGTDMRAYTGRQYRSLTRVTRALLNHYPRLHAGAVVGHAEIAPGRKTDPGPAFEWRRLLDALR